jgi:hypothetical protein
MREIRIAKLRVKRRFVHCTMNQTVAVQSRVYDPAVTTDNEPQSVSHSFNVAFA